VDCDYHIQDQALVTVTLDSGFRDCYIQNQALDQPVVFVTTVYSKSGIGQASGFRDYRIFKIRHWTSQEFSWLPYIQNQALDKPVVLATTVYSKSGIGQARVFVTTVHLKLGIEQAFGFCDYCKFKIRHWTSQWFSWLLYIQNQALDKPVVFVTTVYSKSGIGQTSGFRDYCIFKIRHWTRQLLSWLLYIQNQALDKPVVFVTTVQYNQNQALDKLVVFVVTAYSKSGIGQTSGFRDYCIFKIRHWTSQWF